MQLVFPLIVLAGTVISFCSIGIVFRERTSYNQKLLMMTTTACFITILCYFFEVTSADLGVMLVCAKIEYLGKSVAMYTYLLFIGNYCKLTLPKWMIHSIRNILALLVLCVFTSPLHHLYYRTMSVGYDGWFPYFDGKPGPMYILFMFLMNAIVMCYNCMIVIRLCSCRKSDSKKLWILLLSGVLPSAAFLIVMGCGLTFLDMVPMGYVISCSFLVLLIKKYGLLDTLQIAKESIAENTREGLIVVDTSFDVLYANAIVTKRYPDIYHIKKEEDEEKFKMIFATPESIYQQDNLHFEIRISELYENEQLKGYLAWVFNMAFIDRYTSEILELKQEADRANLAKSAFLANMSHEIRTPMNAILGFAELIFQKARSREVIQYAYHIKRSSRNLLHIINGVLDISKIESGKKEAVSEVYYTQSLLSDVLVLIQTIASEKGLALVRRIDENLPFQMQGDCYAIREILLNVLSNAVKYTEQGTVTLAACCREETEDGMKLCFEITDTGHGMQEEDLLRIYDKFTRFEKSENIHVEGTGLGMAITKGLVEMLGGTLTISSTYGKGTTVMIVIPQKISGERKLGALQTEKIIEYEEKKQHDFIADANILIVDDNEMNLRIVSDLLKRYMIRSDLALNGYEALEKAGKNQYDIIFMDHMMPGIDGVETMHRMRAIGADYCKLPIIALTANAILGVREEMIKVGFHDYLSKPLDLHALEKMLLKYLPESCVTVTPQVQDSVDQEKLYAMQDILVHMDVREGIRYCGGSLEQYEEIIQLMEGKGVKRKKMLEQMIQNEDYENYIINVHALKSSAASIGAKELSEMAAQQELSGKQGDFEYLRENMPELLLLYSIVTMEIALYFQKKKSQRAEGAESSSAEQEIIKGSELEDFMTDIQRLLEAYDFDKAAKITEGLIEVTEAEAQIRLEGLLTGIKELNMEEAMEQIKQIKMMISGI